MDANPSGITFLYKQISPLCRLWNLNQLYLYNQNSKHMYRIHTIIKIFTISFLSICCSIATVKGSNSLTASQDSLLLLLKNASDNERKIELLTHLSDIGLLQDDYKYTLELWNLALQCNDQQTMSITIRPLALRYLDVCQLDSADVWINNCHNYLKGKEREKLIQYLGMMRDIRDMTQRKELAQKLLAENPVYDPKEDRYKKMRRLYCLGVIASMAQYNKELSVQKSCNDYLKEGLEIAKTIPLEEDYIFRTQFLLGLSGSPSLKYTEELLEVYKEYRELPATKKRVFSSHRTEIAVVARMLTLGEQIGRKQMDYYFKEFNRLIKLYPQDVAPPLDFYYYYVAVNYYEYTGNYSKAIECCDSAIKTAPKYGMDNAYLYEDKSKYLARLGHWKEAYHSVNEYMVIKDSIDSQDLASQLNKLQTQYDVNKLQLEKANLIASQQKTFLWFTSVILLILAGWIIYIYRTLSITRRLKIHVEKQSSKAMESEKMKVLFMNSMSHEIRTPLNAIQGFSHLLLSENIDEEMKPAMKDSLEQGVMQLTNLLNDMLQISQLGCTNDSLPTAEIDIDLLCRKCLAEERDAYGKNTVEYIFENLSGIQLFNTNQQHLEKVLHNLLANANKFTQRGQITLVCSYDSAKKVLLLSVADTGIGIPSDKQTWVFEAFTKIDDFTPGTGLGLYVCKETIKHLNGKIYIDPSYRNGTKIVIELPECPPSIVH